MLFSESLNFFSTWGCVRNSNINRSLEFQVNPICWRWEIKYRYIPTQGLLPQIVKRARSVANYCGFFITALTQQLKKLKTVYENTTFYIRKQVPRTVIFSLFRNKSNLRISCLDRCIFFRVKYKAKLNSMIWNFWTKIWN